MNNGSHIFYLVVEVKLRKEEGQNPAQEQQAQGVEPGTSQIIITILIERQNKS